MDSTKSTDISDKSQLCDESLVEPVLITSGQVSEDGVQFVSDKNRADISIDSNANVTLDISNSQAADIRESFLIDLRETKVNMDNFRLDIKKLESLSKYHACVETYLMEHLSSLRKELDKNRAHSFYITVTLLFIIVLVLFSFYNTLF